MGTPRRPKEWFEAANRLKEFLKTRKVLVPDLCAMVAKSTEQTKDMVRNPVYSIVLGNTVVSYMWVVIARVLGVKLCHIFNDPDWAAACEFAYREWADTSSIGKRTDRAFIKQAIWTNRLTGEQIDPATATQAKEDQPMKAPIITPTNTITAPTPSIVELAAQFEVAQKRLAAAAAEHKAAQEALETLRAQLTAAIKP